MNTIHLQPKQPMENDAIMIKKRPPKLKLWNNDSKMNPIFLILWPEMNGHGHEFGHEFVSESVSKADSDTDTRFFGSWDTDS